MLLAIASGMAGFFVWGGDIEVTKPTLTWLLYALSFLLAGAGMIALILGAVMSFWREKRG